MKKIIFILLFTLSLSAKTITPNEVYSQVMLISDEVHYLLKYYGIKHDHEGILKRTKVSVKLKPRNTWQLTYEIMVKINILREQYNLPVIEPINMAPVLHLNPDLVFEQTQRILAELEIFKIRQGIKSPLFELKVYKGKTPLSVYNALTHISRSIDELNKGGVTPSYVFAENMRVYDDLTLLLSHLHIQDKTIPDKKNKDATPSDTFREGMNILEKIKQLQIASGIEYVDFRELKEDVSTPSDVFSITQMIIAELQTLKAYIGLNVITRAASKYNTKTPAEVDQLMSWNLRKLNLIHSLNQGR